MIPDCNNVHGLMTARHSLTPVLGAVERLVGSGGRATHYRSGFDGAKSLEFVTESAEFASAPLGGGEHLLNGGVGGTLEDVLAFVRALSGVLSEAEVEHRFEVSDDRRRLLYFIPSSTEVSRGGHPPDEAPFGAGSALP
jgi:hypothetical protein